MALVTQHIVSASKENKVYSTLTTDGGVFYLTVATRSSALVIKVSVRKHSDAFKRRLGFSFTVIIFFLLLLKSFTYMYSYPKTS